MHMRRRRRTISLSSRAARDDHGAAGGVREALAEEQGAAAYPKLKMLMLFSVLKRGGGVPQATNQRKGSCMRC
ncbi:hypothetical protein N9L68_07890 [bacterium]|nr:hypothetical protein [bacterium]